MAVPTTLPAPSYTKASVKTGSAQILIANGVGANFTAWVDMGLLEDAPELEYKALGYFDLKSNQFAEVILDRISKGRELAYALKLQQTSIDDVIKAFPDITVAGSTVKKMIFSHGIGLSLYDLGRPMVIRRLADPLTPVDTATAWPIVASSPNTFVVPLACPMGDAKWSLDGSPKNSVFDVKIATFLDLTAIASGFGYMGAGTSS